MVDDATARTRRDRETSTVQRPSNTTRRQRDGAKFVDGYGAKTGDSDLLFDEGQLPEEDGEIDRRASPARSCTPA